MLAEILARRIKEQGPITFRDWMQSALYDPLYGYYCRADIERWGRKGDYRTSPERTPLFAATFACYFADVYQQIGSDEKLTIVETGAGNGSFAETALATLEQQFPKVYEATRYVVEEIGGHSNKVAKAKLAKFGERVSFGSIEEHKFAEAGILFSNELLDAFPVHRVVWEQGKLREMYVTVDGEGAFTWTTGPLSTERLSKYFDLVGKELSDEGQIAEVNLEIETWLERAERLFQKAHIVTVDYGDEASNLLAPERRQGTARAFRRHQFQDLLKTPGENDITTTVDWTFVRRLGDKLGLRTDRFERLDQFLLHQGLLDQLEHLTGLAGSDSEEVSLRAGAREMIFPNGMSASFQVLVQRKG
jgi:SAM-dependent MidA family methyltransferase